MKNTVDYLEKKLETDLIKRTKQFLKDQEFIKQHLRDGGSFEELKKMGFKFGTFDIDKLNNATPKFNSVKLHSVLQALIDQRKLFKQHIEQGGSLADLKKMGYKFGTINLSGY